MVSHQHIANTPSAPVPVYALLDVIQMFKEDMAEFNAAGDEEIAAYGGDEAFHEATIGSSWTLLADWLTPAATMEEAVAAAHLALRCDGDAVAVAMTSAAMGYLTRVPSSGPAGGSPPATVAFLLPSSPEAQKWDKARDVTPPASPISNMRERLRAASTDLSLDGIDAKALLTTPEAAACLRASLPTLARWRHDKIGPIHIKRGGHVFYTVGALRDYIEASARKGTRPDR
ncbi:helix-turn-helix protein [Rhizobium sp. PP-WC-1G-195]|nr:helix-turn-helix protein [Rhizobium sp. PP-WC-1G-195]